MAFNSYRVTLATLPTESHLSGDVGKLQSLKVKGSQHESERFLSRGG